MRVLFSTVPELGHFFPLAPLARALYAAGHDVRFATAAALAPRIEAAGFPAVPVGKDLGGWFVELRRRTGTEPGAGLAPDEIMHWFVPNLFAAVGAPSTLADLVPLVEMWRPQVIVHDSYEFAAPLAAARIGVPSVQHMLGPCPPLEDVEAAGQVLAPRWRDAGLEPEPFAGAFRGPCFRVAPTSLEGPLPPELRARVHAVRPVGYDTAPEAEAPEWISALPDRPTVYGTLGTFLNTDLSVFRAILDGSADEPMNVVLTIGRGNDPAGLGPAPANARVEVFVPQSLLLPRCAAVVCHGGSGTILPALARGLPLGLIPQGADNFLNAERCVAAGVGLALMPGQVSPAAVRAMVERLLHEPTFAERARQVAAEIAGMPLPEDIVPMLEALARGDVAGSPSA
jgi:UDP:flavonoid glycosyltransferase YjiC (YdhE family)